MIELVTFTGVDEYTSIENLRKMNARYPHAEFAVLVGSNTERGGHTIFPPLRVIDELRDAMGVSCAVHLCGSYARAIAAGEFDGPLKVSDGFRRVQVNLHGDALSPGHIDLTVARLATFATRSACERVIVQHRDSRWPVPPLPWIEYLFDQSGGTGQESFDHWPAPPADQSVRVGYAGGLSPANIGRALHFAQRYLPEARLWFDMESRIRRYDHFDLEAVQRVCSAVWPAL